MGEREERKKRRAGEGIKNEEKDISGKERVGRGECFPRFVFSCVACVFVYVPVCHRIDYFCMSQTKLVR